MGTDWRRRLLRSGGRGGRWSHALTPSPMLFLADVTIRRHRRRHVHLLWQKVTPTVLRRLRLPVGFFSSVVMTATLTRREDMHAPMVGTSVLERGRTEASNASHSHSQHPSAAA